MQSAMNAQGREDDLLIRMIANTKKLTEKPKKNSVQLPLNAISDGTLYQIFTERYLSHSLVQQYPSEFAHFISAKSPTIIGAFEKSIVGKDQ